MAVHRHRASSFAVVTSVAASTSSVLLLPENTTRCSAAIFNHSNKNMYVTLGPTSSLSSFTIKVERDFLYEVPGSYIGVLSAIWDTGVTGSAMVTEVDG